MIKDHVFRGENACLYPNCGATESQHRSSAEAGVKDTPHWYTPTLKGCLFCGKPWNTVAHFLSSARRAVVGWR